MVDFVHFLLEWVEFIFFQRILNFIINQGDPLCLQKLDISFPNNPDFLGKSTPNIFTKLFLSKISQLHLFHHNVSFCHFLRLFFGIIYHFQIFTIFNFLIKNKTKFLTKLTFKNFITNQGDPLCLQKLDNFPPNNPDFLGK